MVQACKAKNIPEPYYEVRPGGVAIVFRFKDINNESNSNQNCELDCELDCELKLTDKQKVILYILMSDGEKTASWIASQLEVGLRSDHWLIFLPWNLRVQRNKANFVVVNNVYLHKINE